jgi:RNA polymerase sigma-70 factor (ECF subfamily)
MTEDAFLDLYRQRAAAVARRARRIVGDDALADDLMHNTFLTLHRVCSEGRVPEAPFPWLYRTVTNLALNHVRDSKRRETLLAENQAMRYSPATTPFRIGLTRILAEVPEDVAVVASYFFLDDMSQTEIAMLLGRSRRSVGRLLEIFKEAAERHLDHSMMEERHAL